MGWVLVIVGGLIGLIGYVGGLSVDPRSAPQQAVQELRFLHGALGLLLVAFGALLIRLPEMFSHIRLANSTVAPEPPKQPQVAPPEKFKTGDQVTYGEDAGEVVGIESTGMIRVALTRRGTISMNPMFLRKL